MKTPMKPSHGDSSVKGSWVTQLVARRMEKMRKSTLLKLVAFGFALSLVPMLNGCSEDSTVAPEPVIQDTAPPAPPVGITIQRRDTGVKLAWAPNMESDLAGYNIWIYDPSPNAVQAYVKLNNGLVTDSEFSSSKLSAGRSNQYFRLTAVDEYGNESAFSSVVVSGVQYTISE
jgi:hypothetical protein